MEQKKKDVLKKAVAKVAPTPGAIVKGAVGSAYTGVKNAVSGAASTISKKLKERFGPVHYQNPKELKTNVPLKTTPASTSTTPYSKKRLNEFMKKQDTVDYSKWE